MLEAQYQKYKDDGLLIVTMMVDGDAASSDLMNWATTFGLSFPVLADDYRLWSTWGLGFTPAQHLIGPGSVIIEINSYFDDAYIEAVLGL